MPWVILGWAIIVVVSMLVVIVLSQRWGHDPFGFALLAAAMGPIAIVALVGTHHRDRGRPHAIEGARRTGEAGACVIVPVDGSETSVRAARAAPGLAAAATEAVVLTVLPREAEPRRDATPAQQQEHQREVDRLTREAVRALQDAGLPTRVVVGYGAPGEVIVAVARDERAEAIVIGRRGAGLTKALLGSVSDHVVRHATVPVVIVD